MSSEAVVNIDIQGKLPKVASGKVRDLYAIDDATLLFVASDRISAYDVIMENVSFEHSYAYYTSLDYGHRCSATWSLI
jgi:phosphoribosylaminoimidazole-succinocarboxamide synthase